MIKTWQQRCEEHPDHEGIVTEQMIRERMQEEIDELRQALAQPEQEPVAWLIQYKTRHDIVWGSAPGLRNNNQILGMEPLYTAPPKREWVGLTDEEIWDLGADHAIDLAWAREIEAKLKEKNV